MTEHGPEIYTKEMLAADLEARREEEKKAAAEVAQERAIEEMREAWIQENGAVPTESEIKQALALMRQGDAAERAKRNQQIASRRIRQLF